MDKSEVRMRGNQSARHGDEDSRVCSYFAAQNLNELNFKAENII